ncbi:MAG: RidA family protein [Alphaproteobacteria bacterium]
MIGKRISSNSKFEKLARFARAVVLPDPGGDWVLVSGTTGYDYRSGEITGDVSEQTRQAFRNIRAALTEADCTLDDLVCVRVFLARQADFETVAQIVGEHCYSARPANTTVVAALAEPEILVEIEVTARKPA